MGSLNQFNWYCQNGGKISLLKILKFIPLEAIIPLFNSKYDQILLSCAFFFSIIFIKC